MHKAASDATVSPDGVVHLFPNVEVEALCGHDREPPKPSHRSSLSEPFILEMERLKEQIHLSIPSNTEYQILN